MRFGFGDETRSSYSGAVWMVASATPLLFILVGCNPAVKVESEKQAVKVEPKTYGTILIDPDDSPIVLVDGSVTVMSTLQDLKGDAKVIDASYQPAAGSPLFRVTGIQLCEFDGSNCVPHPQLTNVNFANLSWRLVIAWDGPKGGERTVIVDVSNVAAGQGERIEIISSKAFEKFGNKRRRHKEGELTNTEFYARGSTVPVPIGCSSCQLKIMYHK